MCECDCESFFPTHVLYRSTCAIRMFFLVRTKRTNVLHTRHFYCGNRFSSVIELYDIGIKCFLRANSREHKKKTFEFNNGEQKTVTDTWFSLRFYFFRSFISTWTCPWVSEGAREWVGAFVSTIPFVNFPIFLCAERGDGECEPNNWFWWLNILPFHGNSVAVRHSSTKWFWLSVLIQLPGIQCRTFDRPIMAGCLVKYPLIAAALQLDL